MTNHPLTDDAFNLGSAQAWDHIPRWVTLKVLWGGFATQEMLAGGSLRAHEEQLFLSLKDSLLLPDTTPSANIVRTQLNLFFLSDKGKTLVRQWLYGHTYTIEYPEEAAIASIVLLQDQGYEEQANTLIRIIQPYFHLLRFYPIPTDTPILPDGRMAIEDIAMVTERLQSKKTPHKILVQKEWIQIWAPFFDDLLRWIIQKNLHQSITNPLSPHDQQVAQEWVHRYMCLAEQHTLCTRARSTKQPYAKLLRALQKILSTTDTSTGALRQIGHITQQLIAKRGHPDSAKNQSIRAQAQQSVAAPLHKAYVPLAIQRLHTHEHQGFVDASLNTLYASISSQEAETFMLPVGDDLPEWMTTLMRRCRLFTPTQYEISHLSPEQIAQHLPLSVGYYWSLKFTDPTVQHLAGKTYQAFAGRRSLLLLGLATQTHHKNIPWLAILERSMSKNLTAHEATVQNFLEQLQFSYLSAYPETLTPNKWLQELENLGRLSKKPHRWLKNLATDIFMGVFSDRYITESLETAAELKDTLYARYFQLPYQELLDLPLSNDHNTRESLFSQWVQRHIASHRNPLITNGRMIETVQLLTTHNLRQHLQAAQEYARQHHKSSDPIDLASRCWLSIHITIHKHCLQQSPHLSHVGFNRLAIAWRHFIFFFSAASQEEQTRLLKRESKFYLGREDSAAFQYRATHILNQWWNNHLLPFYHAQNAPHTPITMWSEHPLRTTLLYGSVESL